MHTRGHKCSVGRKKHIWDTAAHTSSFFLFWKSPCPLQQGLGFLLISQLGAQNCLTAHLFINQINNNKETQQHQWPHPSSVRNFKECPIFYFCPIFSTYLFLDLQRWYMFSQWNWPYTEMSIYCLLSKKDRRLGRQRKTVLRIITHQVEHSGRSSELRVTQEALGDGELPSYPKSWSSSASPYDLLHRSEGSWVLIFASGVSALAIHDPHVHEAPAKVLWVRGREGRLCCSSQSPLLGETQAGCSCKSPTSKEVKLGYSSHWHSPPRPWGTGRSVVSVRKHAKLGSHPKDTHTASRNMQFLSKEIKMKVLQLRLTSNSDSPQEAKPSFFLMPLVCRGMHSITPAFCLTHKEHGGSF